MHVDVAVAKLKDIALLERWMPVEDVPDAHQQRFSLQKEHKGVYLLAFDAGIPVGYVTLQFKNPYELSREAYSNYAYVEGLSVDADQHRRGIGTLLMQSLERYAQREGFENIGLYVGVGNLPARSLYKSLLYEPTDLPPYLVTWKALNRATGAFEDDGEVCNFWTKAVGKVLTEDKSTAQ